MDRGKQRRWLRPAVLLTATLLVAAACGDDKGSTTTPTTTAKPAGATTTVASTFVKGCSAGKSWIDPTNLDATRPVARCDAGTPEPKPLAAKTKITVAILNKTSEFTMPFVYGLQKGEYAKENIDLEIVNRPSAEAYVPMGKGEIDAVFSGPEAAFHNTINQGFNLKLVAGNFFPAKDGKTGVWANKKCSAWGGKQPAASDLKGKTIGSLIGSGSVILYPIADAVKKAGGTLKDVQLKQLPSGADFITALKNCVADAAWVLDPTWTALINDPDMVFLVGQPPGEPIGGLMYGPNLLEKNREAGVALMRAYIRTINTYFPLNYHDNAAFVQELSTLMNQQPSAITAIPALQFDWEVRAGTDTRIQTYHIEASSQTGALIPEDKAVDRSFYEIAVGKRAA